MVYSTTTKAYVTYPSDFCMLGWTHGAVQKMMVLLLDYWLLWSTYFWRHKLKVEGGKNVV